MRSGSRTVLERTGFVAVVALVLLVGAYQGIQTESVTVRAFGWFVRVVVIDAVPATVTFSAFALVSAALLVREVYAEADPSERLRSGPRVAAIVPAYRDAAVIGESVESLLASNYRDLEIVLACEPGDESTLAAAREYAAHPDVRVLENRDPGSKAGAINDAVERVDAAYFTAIDVDERIDPDFLPRAMYHLTAAGRDVFQARRVPRVTGPVEALAYCERLLFHAGYKLVEPLGFTYCRSSSVAFTREAFDAVGGLDDLLTEDLDFAHKCYRAGLSVRQARNVTTEMEAPHTIRDLWYQRKRWRIGHIQLLSKALRGGYDRGGIRGLLSTARIATSLAATVYLLALVAKVAMLVALDLEVLFLLPMLAVALTVAPVASRDYRDGHIVSLSPAFALAPVVYAGFGLLTIRSAFAYASSWNGEWYRVEKTGA